MHQKGSTSYRRYIRCWFQIGLDGWRRSAATACLGLAAMTTQPTAAPAPAPTPDPGTWRPLAYAELRKPSARHATYIDIWKSEIDANNRAYEARGDRRFAGGNAPATEAHFVIWSPKRAVVLSVLNTALGCSPKQRERDLRVLIKLCPMRIAIYQGLEVRTLDAGWGCFLEPVAGTWLDPSASAAYGAYDIASRTLKIGMIVDHRAIDGCSFNIPLPKD